MIILIHGARIPDVRCAVESESLRLESDSDSDSDSDWTRIRLGPPSRPPCRGIARPAGAPRAGPPATRTRTRTRIRPAALGAATPPCVRSLCAAPSRCGIGPSGREQSGWLINQLGNPSFESCKSKIVLIQKPCKLQDNNTSKHMTMIK